MKKPPVITPVTFTRVVEQPRQTGGAGGLEEPDWIVHRSQQYMEYGGEGLDSDVSPDSGARRTVTLKGFSTAASGGMADLCEMPIVSL